MKVLVMLVVFLPAIALSESVNISVGSEKVDARAALIKMGSLDISSDLEVVGPKDDFCWDIPNFKAVIELFAKDGKVVKLYYWTEKDFNESKLHREQTRLPVKGISFDTVRKLVTTKS